MKFLIIKILFFCLFNKDADMPLDELLKLYSQNAPPINNSSQNDEDVV
jgi:hypothetical protein